jgi:hypothetical protein
MKRNILFTTAALFATGSLLAAPKDDVSAAIKKLADGGNYSWTSTVTNVPPPGGGGGGGGFGGGFGGGRGGGPTTGKITKEGFTLISRAGRGGAMTETLVKGEKSVTKNADSGAWQTPEEAAAARGDGGGGGFGGGRGFGRGFGAAANRLPTLDAQELLAAVSELKSADGALSGDLSKEAVNARLMPGGGRGFGGGEAPPPPANAKGSVKYWLKDGALSKFEFNVQGTMDFGGNEFPINRTTTVEFKDVGTTKMDVPEDAKKKLQ